MKRHEKPYGCTYQACKKRFGSKNDWKRHENSQHYQLELWKCNEKSTVDVNEVCCRTFNRREQFKTHLSKDHHIEDPHMIDDKLEKCLDGRNYGIRFWCGFCRTMVKLEGTGTKAWQGRFNHVDDHFSGQKGPKMDISQWESLDCDSQEVQVVVAEPAEASKHKSWGQTSASAAAGPGDGSAERTRKRSAVEEAHHKPSKKVRTGTVWYCVGLINPFVRLTTTSLTVPPVRLQRTVQL